MLNITIIFLLFIIYFLFYFITLKFSNCIRWSKVLGLTVSSYIYLLILDSLFKFDCFSIKFQNIEAYISLQNVNNYTIDLLNYNKFYFETYNYYLYLIKKYKFFFETYNITSSDNIDSTIILNKSYFLCYYGIDSISLVFLLLISLLTPLIIIINWEQSVFPLFLLNNILFLEFCLLNLFWVLDFFFFFFFFEISLIPMFFIIGVFGSRQRKKRASLLFFLYSFFGSFFLLFSLLLIIFDTGSTSFIIIFNYNFSLIKQKILWICFFLSFGSKFPLYPFHIWLPEAHVEAPTSGSIILAAILLKIGAYGVLRFMLPLLPLANLFYGSFIHVISLITITLSSWVALRQTDIKKIIAYSSISHMGLGFLGLFSGNFFGIAGSLFLMICHGFVSSGLFYIAGLLYERFYTRQIFEYGGLCLTMPGLTFFLFLLSLANISFPGFGNFFAEILLLYGLFLKKNIIILIIIFHSLFITVIYSFWLYSRIVFGTLKFYTVFLACTQLNNKTLFFKDNFFFFNLYHTNYSDLNRREFFILLVLLIFLIFLGIYPQFFFNFFYTFLKVLLL